jgi:hypothetical protein
MESAGRLRGPQEDAMSQQALTASSFAVASPDLGSPMLVVPSADAPRFRAAKSG